MIGRGGFGIVYHGLLDDGREVAVKMISKSSQGTKEFRAEVSHDHGDGKMAAIFLYHFLRLNF